MQKTQNTHVRRKFTCHNLISTSTQPVECSLNTNSPDQFDTGNSKMSITENDLCEIDDTVVTCSDETLNVPMEAAEVLILDRDSSYSITGMGNYISSILNIIRWYFEKIPSVQSRTS